MTNRLIWTAFWGLSMVGVTFGMARYGYGLFLPEFIETFSLDKQTQGLIGSGSYLGYVFATALASWLSGYAGPRYPLALGAVCAVAGTALVAASASPLSLAIGVFIAGASPGAVFPALSDWASMQEHPEERNKLFTIMNSGTGAGIIIATPLAWLLGTQWRYAWLIFALAAAIVGLMAVLLAPPRKSFLKASIATGTIFKMRLLIAPHAIPLYTVSFLSGFTTAIYWTFSVDTISRTVPAAFGIDRPEMIFWILTGFSGFLGAFAGNAVNKSGHVKVLRYTMIAFAISSCLLGLLSHNIVAVLLSGLIFGAAFIFITGLLGVWSMIIFKIRPSAGFGVTFLLFTAGAVFGPSVSGLAAPLIGQNLVFVAAGIVAISICLIPERYLS